MEKRPAENSRPIEVVREYILLAGILILSLLVRLPFLHEPFERDEGLYAYMGQEILRGAVIYRDVIDIKPPGIFYLNALMIFLGGPSFTAIRLFSFFYSLGTVAAVYFFTRRCFGRQSAIWAALLYGLYSSGPIIQGSSSNCEVFMMLPVVLSAYLFIVNRETGNRLILAGSGLVTGIAMVIKTTTLPHFLLIVLFIALETRSSWRQKTRELTLFILPPALLALAIIGWFWSKGALTDFYYWNVSHNRLYASTSLELFLARLTGRGLEVSHEFLLLWIAGIPTATVLAMKGNRNYSLFAALLLPAAAVGIAMPGKFWPHYFIQLIFPLSVLSGTALAYLTKLKTPSAWVGLAVAGSVFCMTVVKEYHFYLTDTPEEISAKKYGSDIFVASVSAADYLQEHTTPEEYIFQWGWEPELYFLANRRSPNKFTSGLFTCEAPDPQEAVDAMIQSIHLSKPKYLIIQDGRDSWCGNERISNIARAFYHPETRIGTLTLFRRNDASPSR